MSRPFTYPPRRIPAPLRTIAAALTEALSVVRRKRRAIEPFESVGQRLGRLRRERGLTQAELAQALDVPQSYISRYERGVLRLHADLIIRSAAILRTSADELLGLTPARDGNGVGNRRLRRHLREIDRLPRRDQHALLKTIEAYIRAVGPAPAGG